MDSDMEPNPIEAADSAEANRPASEALHQWLLDLLAETNDALVTATIQKNALEERRDWLLRAVKD
jgi:hypothetical protein